MNYTAADQILQGRNKTSKKQDNNTYLQRRGNNIALLYHDTDVLTFHPDNSIVLDSGGWHTMSTKERINSMLPGGYILSQVKGRWFVNDSVYQDGMTIDAAGKITGAGRNAPKLDTKLKARVKAYAAKCAAAIPLDQPDGGDCWFCYMKTQSGQTLGDANKDPSHLDEHIKQSYIVPSLVYNAIKENANAPMVFWQVFKGTGWTNEDREFGRQAVKKAVYRYILKRKGLAA